MQALKLEFHDGRESLLSGRLRLSDSSNINSACSSAIFKACESQSFVLRRASGNFKALKTGGGMYRSTTLVSC